ncbi:hypothetical protein BDZ89DRAFT_1107825 [Hymenopellis radicata]|nr:hypothetical protein BDZ89DRAFT_1107825 [Hymenopellis radicata]
MSYSSQGQYHPPPHYHSSSSSLSSGHEPVYTPHPELTAPPPQQEQAPQRKRPKYTRSKTGCMTCRQKKIKCDESKPACVRCTHSQRNCTWPEGLPVRKRVPQRRDSIDERPSTAGSSVSDESSPSLRNASPPRRLDPEVGLLPPLIPRRNQDPYLQLPPVMQQESDFDRRICHVLHLRKGRILRPLCIRCRKLTRTRPPTITITLTTPVSNTLLHLAPR